MKSGGGGGGGLLEATVLKSLQIFSYFRNAANSIPQVRYKLFCASGQSTSRAKGALLLGAFFRDIQSIAFCFDQSATWQKMYYFFARKHHLFKIFDAQTFAIKNYNC